MPRTAASSTRPANLFQLFQPIGGVRANALSATLCSAGSGRRSGYAPSPAGTRCAVISTTGASGRRWPAKCNSSPSTLPSSFTCRSLFPSIMLPVRVKPSGPPVLSTILMDGNSERHVKYEGKLVGEELHLAGQRRPDAPVVEMTAHRVPAGEGAYPERRPLPALHKVADNALARTPPMGWNSWNKFAGRVEDAAVRGMADAMAANGMKDAGYVYVNIDDTWQGEREKNGNITTNKKFPDMKALADYVHSKGLKIGIYSSPGPNTCAGYEGSYGHEEQDAKTYAEWGIDYLNYDWCGARNLYKDEEMQAVYQIMGEALLKVGRPILYSLCQYGRAEVWKWGPEVGGNTSRTTGDIRDTWESMSKIGIAQDALAPYAAPGHWNDPDMLEIGNGGMNDDEYRTQMSLWSILAAPLLAGNDLGGMSPVILEILTNREVIAVNQDKAGKQGRRVAQSGEQGGLARPAADGRHAIGMFNRAAGPATGSGKTGGSRP